MTSEVVLFLLLLLQIRMKSRTSRTMAHFLVSFFWGLTRGPAHAHGWIYKRVTPRTPLIEQAASNALITRVQTPPPRAPAGEAICHARCHGEDEKTVPSVDDVELGEEPLGSVYTPGGRRRQRWVEEAEA